MIQIIIFLIGLVNIFIGLRFKINTVNNSIFLAIGITFISTALLTFVQHRLAGDPFKGVLTKIRTSTDELSEKLISTVDILETGDRLGIRSFHDNRQEIAKEEWIDLLDSEESVYLFGMALHQYTDHPDFFKKILKGIRLGCKYKILLLDPSNTDIIRMRARDEHTDPTHLQNRIKTSLDKLTSWLNADATRQANVEVKVFNHYPTFTISKGDNDMILSFYIFDTEGNRAPTMRLQADRVLGHKINRIFLDIFEKDSVSALQKDRETV